MRRETYVEQDTSPSNNEKGDLCRTGQTRKLSPPLNMIEAMTILRMFKGRGASQILGNFF